MNKLILIIFLISICKNVYSIDLNNIFESSFYRVEFTSNNIEKDESNLYNEDSDYKDLNTRLKEIKSTIALLEKIIFK